MYVGISKTLKDDILRHITRMEEAQLKRVTDATHPFPDGLSGPEWAARIERVAWGDPIKLKDKVPEDWLRPHSTIDVYFPTDDAETLHVKFSGSTIDFPPTFSSDYVPDITLMLNQVEPEIAENIRKHFRLLKETGERYEKTKEEIVRLLDRCKSLNEAVQLFPDLRYFLSEEIKERLDRKRDGGKHEPDSRLVGIDTALITSAMVVEQLHPESE